MDSTKHVKLLTGEIYKEFNVRNLFNSLIDVFSMVMKKKYIFKINILFNQIYVSVIIFFYSQYNWYI